MKSRIQEVIGKRFGSLFAIRAGQRELGRTLVYCRCDCGIFTWASASCLRRGKIKSCGCDLARRNKNRATHKHAPRNGITAEYRAWKSMKARCTNPNTAHFERYGGRGIRVCEEWENDFEAFFSYIGPRPTPHHSVDRYPNNDGNYEPGNVRWATKSEQIHNRGRSTL